MPSTSTTPPPLPSTSAYPARRLAWGAAAVAAGLAGAYLLLGSRGRRMVANALPMVSEMWCGVLTRRPMHALHHSGNRLHRSS